MDKLSTFNKFLLGGTLVLALMVGASFLLPKSATTAQTITSSKKTVRITQIVNNAKDPVRTTHKLEVVEGTTALDVLKNNAKVVAKGQGENALVTEINGKKAEDLQKEFWAFYVNGKEAQVGAGSYVVKKGDILEWRIEHY